MDAPVRAAVGLGSNLGNSRARLEAAFVALDGLPGTRLASRSRLYRTPAWGLTEQPDFVNAVACVDTLLPPRALLDALLALEREAGRDRTHDTRWGPRVLDLDILLYGDSRIDEPGLHVPHPHLHVRAFALVPLLEAWPEAPLPGRGSARAALDGLAAVARIEVEALG